jgi:hypothetical protein
MWKEVPAIFKNKWVHSERYFSKILSSHDMNMVAQWLRNYATNRKVIGSIPDEAIFLNLPNPSDHTRPWGLLSL